MNNINEKNSSIELLRIFLVFLVILIHATPLGKIKLGEISNINLGVTYLIYSFARPAVNIFIIISGYFLCDKVINIKKSTNKLLQPILFFLPVLFFYSIISLNENGYGLIKSLLLSLLYIPTLGGVFFHLWYIASYILLLLATPYLNLIIRNLESKKLLNLIFICLLPIVLISSISDFFGLKVTYFYSGPSFTELGFYNFFIFIPLYLIGAYFRKNKVVIKYAFIKYIICSLFIASFSLAYSFNFTPINILSSLLNRSEITRTYNLYEAIFKYNNVFVLMSSIYLFYFFSSLKIKNTIVNVIGKMTFGMYVFHSVILSIVYKVILSDENFLYYPEYLPSVIIIFLVVVITFIVALLFEFIRIKLKEKYDLYRKNNKHSRLKI
ncbi:acyltransferase [Paenibacillus sp. FSL R7-0345]|uniref:acyltransferase n=1 Tax=Paenibacillus sp. FSL R7-0345 TaxID=2954535 RepID=UPI00315AA4B3